jgi:IQ calmodulin-binding motif
MNEVQAAVTIQKVWRGYQTRHLDVNVRDVKNRMRLNRAEDHVTHLTRQMSVTRELCQMQDQRIEALEAELRREHERGDSTSEQCRQLQRQVHELQETMQQILDWMAYSNSPSTGGQVAPQTLIRPRTLSLTIKTAPESAPPAAQPVEDFARGMAHHLIQSSVSESGDEAKC